MENYHKYLNIGEFEKKWGFYINTVGSAKVAPNKHYPNNRLHPNDHSFTWDKGRILDSYYVVYITKGEGLLESATSSTVRIKAGSCFILYPGVWHRYKPFSESGWEEYWVGFNGSYPRELMHSGIFMPENAFIDVGLNEDLLQLFHALIKEVSVAELGYRQNITGMTLQILSTIQSITRYKAKETDLESRLISKAKFLLQESIEVPVNMDEMVKELPMGYSRFRKAFKAHTGMSPNQYHLCLRLESAKELLLSTNLTVNEVAYKTGFSSIFYFSKLFKKKNSLSPTTFREQHSGSMTGSLSSSA
ncbi:MAG: AraC family transcriptional regulator [Bacteroidota bacterium]